MSDTLTRDQGRNSVRRYSGLPPMLHERAIHAARHGVMITEGSGEAARILFVNKAFEAITGYSAEDVANRSPRLLLRSDRDQFNDLAQAIARGQPASGVLRTYRKDGTMFWSELNIDPVFDENGAATHFISALQDVSEREAAHARLLQMEKMEAIGQLTGGIAHDFNNILGATRTFACLLAEEVPAGSRPHEYASRIIAASDRAADMVRQILTFTRAKDAPREQLRICDVVSEVAMLMNGRLPGGVSLSTEDKTAGAVVIANASQLAQVLLNLVANAGDAMLGAGEISILSREIIVGEGEPLPFTKGMSAHAGGGFLVATAELKPKVRYVRLSVSDTGSGIPEDIASNIFEPFFTTKDKRRGSGLGLAVVNNIVSAHDGVVVVQSRAGVGSVFHIYLPASTAVMSGLPPAEKQEGVFSKDRLRGAERILIVDDEVDLADAFSISLTKLGYSTTPVYSPLEAFDIFTRNPQAWDLVITDQSMPGMKGLALIRKIKFIRSGIKTILCTGYSDSSSERSAESSGADAFFTKPVRTEDLAASIRHLMNGRSGDLR